MILEAVVICVNYSDFLAHTISHNKSHFDKMVVVTDLTDTKTKILCDFHNVTCIQTNAFYLNGDILNKGRGINEGLKHLKLNGWVIHLDADIYLPPLTRTILENISNELDENGIYSIDRMMCPNYKEWIKFIEMPKLMHESWVFIHPNIFPMGTRLAEYKNKNSGWEPIGFFQMWHPKTSNIFEYPNEHGAIDRSDVLHSKKWDRKNRHFIPEIIAIHLESDSNKMGINWKGRKSAIFGYIDKPNLLNRLKNYFKS